MKEEAAQGREVWSGVINWQFGPTKKPNPVRAKVRLTQAILFYMLKWGGAYLLVTGDDHEDCEVCLSVREVNQAARRYADYGHRYTTIELVFP